MRPGEAVRVEHLGPRGDTGFDVVIETTARIASVLGWVVFLAGFVLILFAVIVPSAFAQISPGPLSKAHRELDGPAGCTKCHAVSVGSPEFRCLDCHREIAIRLQQKRGAHPSYMNGSTGSATCVKCHSEHNGAGFALIKWEPSQNAFDHRITGFVLDGKHASISCAQCHNPSRLSSSEKLLLGRDSSHTFLGLSRSCVSCHEDKHHGSLGPNCTQCHNATDWKRSFDHSTTKYPLRGAHLQVACAKCHAPGTDGQPRYVGLKFDRCSSCHNDPHRGAFEQTCESCHNTGTWKQTLVATRFDHSKTKYPLLGKHTEVSCLSCHRNVNFKTPLAFQACADCHKPDPHDGQFAKRADGGRCESCHTVDGFKKPTFDLAAHSKTGFPLREKHATVACAKCHTPQGKATLFRVKFALCTDCHQDAHKAQFARAPYLNRCEKCHTEAGFTPSTYTLALHQQGRFVLTGSHVAIACNECHKPLVDPKVAAFHFSSLACTACHNDPHKNQFAARMLQAGANGSAAGCEACHSTKEWNDLQRFDHGTTKFTLAGAHRGVQCAGCHRPPNLERNLMNVDFTAAPVVCEECHDDPHGGQFAHGQKTTHCADCHNEMKWRPAPFFDHEKTLFSLKGGHQNVRCKLCHTTSRTVKEAAVIFYKPTPTACAACHNSNVAVGGGA